MYATPPYLRKKIAASTATAMQAPTGVPVVGCTLLSGFESGSWRSRAIEYASRIVEAWIARQQTKIANETTSR